MYRWIAIALLAAGIAGTSFWAARSNNEKSMVSLQAENHYQRAFHELTYNMDILHEKIGTTLAMNSKERLSPQMLDIWRITSNAQSNLGQLPLAMLPFNKTEEFLSQIGDFSYKTAARDLSAKPLTNKETKTLASLYKQSGELNSHMRKLQGDVLNNNLSWLDAEKSLAQRNEKMDNTIMDGFHTVEKKVSGYDEANAGNSLAGNADKDHKNYIQGEAYSKDQALRKAKQIMGDTDDKAFTIQKSGKGANVAAYNIVYEKGNRNGMLDLSVKGGHPLNLLVNRPVPNKKISLYTGGEKAAQYLKNLGFKNMEVVSSTEHDNAGSYSFLPVQDGIRLYPDSAEVKVALDNGNLLGLSGRNYFKNHRDRKLEKPKISVNEARDKVNPNLDIQENYLSLITNELGNEVLCHEFIGVHKNITYRIYINANSGKEEKVERLEGTGIDFR
ncbi:germination protein YpeB [Aciduricibacillus chroicocephali]|uniref:Germination protein YpeB n=1 Tax=Aciduricibacillus chroicocephali TaxID=3054939 RepID=A0ABY9KRX6_9BACI|nr:germination protein YpeB [Bacillaceae bacterium 44XB]